MPNRTCLLLAAALVMACGDDDEPTRASVPELVPAFMWIVAGDGQQGVVGEPAPNPLGIAVETAMGQRVPGVVVTFTVDTENATVESPITTNEFGLALAQLVFGDEPGPVAVTASADGVPSPRPFTMTAIEPGR